MKLYGLYESTRRSHWEGEPDCSVSLLSIDTSKVALKDRWNRHAEEKGLPKFSDENFLKYNGSIEGGCAEVEVAVEIIPF